MRVLEGSGQGEEILRAMKAASRVNKRQMRGNTVSEELIAVTGVAQHKGPRMGTQHGGNCRIRMNIPLSCPGERRTG